MEEQKEYEVELDESVTICESKGCFEIVPAYSGLCDQCKQKALDETNGVKRVPVNSHEKVVDFLWKMLPMSSQHPDMKLTAFGLQSKNNLREMISIMRAVNKE